MADTMLDKVTAAIIDCAAADPLSSSACRLLAKTAIEAMEEATKAHAAVPALLAAAVHAEAVMSIVEPRSDKKEYLETLFELRAAIAAAT